MMVVVMVVVVVVVVEEKKENIIDKSDGSGVTDEAYKEQCHTKT